MEEVILPRLDSAGVFAICLRNRRMDFNLRFVQAKHAKPSLDGNNFKAVLMETVAPIVDGLAQLPQTKVEEVVDILYDASLELTGAGLLGNTKSTGVAAAWASILPHAPHLMAASCSSLVSAVSNAAYNFAKYPGANLASWTTTMAELAPLCDSVRSFREAGKVVAWRSGLTHYRDGALDACSELEWGLAAPCLGLTQAPPVPQRQFCATLRADPWLAPAALAADRRVSVLKVACDTGAFRGFGGQFLRPPDVSYSQGHFFATDGEGWWIVNADLFGVTLTRTAAPGDAPICRPEKSAFKSSGVLKATRGLVSGVLGQVLPARAQEPALSVQADDTITSGTQRIAITSPDQIKSYATDGRSMIVTTTMSHKIQIIGVCTM